ncbi:TetR/AcrR family transcriptional regulator [Komagataeibacter melomenusus]
MRSGRGFPEGCLPIPKCYHKGNVPQDLRIATVRILESERLEDLSVRRLAKEVRVAPANFYNHYGSLNDLLLEIAVEHFQVLREQIAHIRRTSAHRTDALKRIAFYWVDLGRTRSELYRLMFGYLPDAYAHHDYRHAAGAALEDLMELIYGYRVFTLTDDCDPNDVETLEKKVQVGYGLYAMLCGLSSLCIAHAPIGPFSGSKNPRKDTATFLDGVLDAFIKGDMARVLNAKEPGD